MLHGFAPLPLIEVKQLTVYLLGIEIKSIFDSGSGRISAAEPRKGYDVQPLLATFRRKKQVFGQGVCRGGIKQKSSPGDAGGKVKWVGVGGEGLQPGLLGHDAADVDEIISDHAEADPALHSGIAPVAAAIETVSPLDHADAPLAAGAPFLAVAEPALLLLAFALGALGRAIGDADALDALGFRDRLVF